MTTFRQKLAGLVTQKQKEKVNIVSYLITASHEISMDLAGEDIKKVEESVRNNKELKIGSRQVVIVEKKEGNFS